MKIRNFLNGTVLLVVTMLPFCSLAQQKQDHSHYKVIEIGTFGGPNSYLMFSNRTLNNSGVAAGIADTAAAASPPFCLLLPDCFVPHSFVWKDEVMTDLGGLPGVAISGSLPNYINEKGVVAGIAFNGRADDVIGVPQFDAVLWKDGFILDLGTFGGDLSYAAAINDRDEAVGFALNATPDSFDLGDWCQNFPMPTQMRAFIWRNGVKQDLGTLGGTDSCALFINERGQVAGNSFTDSTINPSTGFPTLHPVLWDHDQMLDLGTLGGTIAVAASINNRGQVAGLSWLAGDLTNHPFLWNEKKLVDLGSLGGDTAEVIGLNEKGHVVGKADLPGPLPQIHHAFIAGKEGISDLGTQDGDPCSIAFGINSQDQVVGASSDCSNSLHAFLWEHGLMMDLNAFVPAGSSLTLTQATFINDRGEITAEGVLPNGDQRAVLLIPCDSDHLGIEGCDYSPFEPPATSPAPGIALSLQNPTAVKPSDSAGANQMVRPLHNRLISWSRGLGVRAPK